MKKFFCFFILLTKLSTTNAQNLVLESKLGYAIGEKENSKRILLFRSSGLQYEKEVKYNLSFSSGVSGASAQVSYTDTSKRSVFEKIYIFQIPVLLTKYAAISRNSKFYIQAGPVFSFLPLTKREVFSGSLKETIRLKYSGFNTGLMTNIGIKTLFGKNNWYASMGLSGYQDFSAINKTKTEKVKFNQFGLGFSFIKNFEK